MILIDTKTNEAYSNVSKAAASRIVGVSISTIQRWSKLKQMEVYNHWYIYFNEIKLTQTKGFRIKSKKV